MRLTVLLALLILALEAQSANEQQSVPDDCPVTLPIEPRYEPRLPYDAGAEAFWYGSDRLFVALRADGRWLNSNNRLLWFRMNRDWEADYPRPHLEVSAVRIDGGKAAAIISPVAAESKGEHAAVIPTHITLRQPGCWQISGNYKSDYLSFVVWAD